MAFAPMGLHKFLQQNLAGVDADAHVSHLLPRQPVVSTSLETFPCHTHPTQADASLRTPHRPKLTTSDQIFGNDAYRIRRPSGGVDPLIDEELATLATRGPGKCPDQSMLCFVGMSSSLRDAPTNYVRYMFYRLIIGYQAGFKCFGIGTITCPCGRPCR
jgi:hypothetical protein